MDQDRYRRLKDLTQRALELEAAVRAEFLQRECGDDPALLREVRELLALEAAGDELDLAVPPAPELPDLAGRTLGPYRIVERIGEGGMGAVYLAEQDAPLRRQVALKVIKLGLDTREVIGRFETERQALALMDHPNIAKVLDAGATEEGRPYFVMEYIRGVPLLEFCRRGELELRERLSLFTRICRGVQHAHQKGVIHRDLKPGNILVAEVEGRAEPKIIDFGVAKSIDADLAARTLFTRHGRLVGTPEYMSPEQADLDTPDIDTRSDVYSLGVVLYQLLTGGLPLERREILQAGLEGMGLAVAGRTPVKPSTRLLRAAGGDGRPDAAAGIDTRLWARRVRGDLDWITMKALAKERDRRYQSPSALADDIERHLTQQPVEAGPPSGWYRARKFVGRNRGAVATAALLLAALVAFGGWQTVQSRRIARERDRAVANERLAYARDQLGRDPSTALACALSSLEVVDQPAARTVAGQAVAQGPLRDEIPRGGLGGNPTWVDAGPDGRWCVVARTQSDFAVVGIYDLADHSLRLLESDQEGEMLHVVAGADGAHIAASGGGGINVWRVADGAHLHNIPELGDFNSVHVFRHADPRLATVSANHIDGRTEWFTLDFADGRLRGRGRSIGRQNGQTYHLPATDAAFTHVLDYDDGRVFLQGTGDLGSDRSLEVGRHDAAVTSVALAPDLGTAVSVDETGRIRVWDLSASPPIPSREYRIEPGEWALRYDPHGPRFAAFGGSGTCWIFDLGALPPREPVALPDRSHWVHGAAFLPDGSVLTSRNGIASGPVAVWHPDDPAAWSLDLSRYPGPRPHVRLLRDGRALLLWADDGRVSRVPLAPGSDAAGRLLGQAGGWSPGIWQNLDLGRCGERLLTYSLFEGTHVLDLATGEVQHLSAFGGGSFYAWGLGPDGRSVLFSTFDAPSLFRIYDLDAERIVQEVDLGPGMHLRCRLVDDATLLALSERHIARVDLERPGAPPDTLWTGDAGRGGFLFEEHDAALVCSRDGRLSFLDLATGNAAELGDWIGRGMTSAAYDPERSLLAVGGWIPTVLVFDLQTGAKWRLPARRPGQKLVNGLAIDSLGRWLLVSYDDQIVAWKLPLDPLFGDLPHAGLVAALEARTNIRIDSDPGLETGFRIFSLPAGR